MLAERARLLELDRLVGQMVDVTATEPTEEDGVPTGVTTHRATGQPVRAVIVSAAELQEAGLTASDVPHLRVVPTKGNPCP